MHHALVVRPHEAGSRNLLFVAGSFFMLGGLFAFRGEVVNLGNRQGTRLVGLLLCGLRLPGNLKILKICDGGLAKLCALVCHFLLDHVVRVGNFFCGLLV